jgi:uncharacterized protein YjdB
VLLQESFEDNAFARRGWYDNSSMATTTAQHTAGSTRALEIHFLSGATTPTWGGAARHLFPATPTLYVDYWVKYSTNWVGSGHPYHPHEFLILSDQDGDYDGPSNNWLTAYIEDIYRNGGIPRLALQDNKAINTTFGALPINLVSVTENRSVGGCNGIIESQMFSECFNMPPWYNDKQLNGAGVAFQPNPGPGYKGDWNQVEVYLQMNSVVGGIGRPDGVMQYWFNGALVIDRHDILFRTGARPNIQFHQFMIGPYIGDGSPVDQYMWVDDLLLATSRGGSVPSDSAVASVTVSPASPSLLLGATQQLAATLTDAFGNTLSGRAVTWTSSDPAVATVGNYGLVTGVVAGTATITATSEGKSGTAAVTVTATTTNPGTVTGLSVAAVTNNSVTLSFTEVNDGTGHPASYDIRWATGTISWGSATPVTQGTCQVPVAGTAIGAVRTCTVQGLAPSTGYQFQLVAFRGTLNVNAVFGALSNVASGTTAATTVVPVATVTLSPASASLTVGTTQQFAATLRDASGNTLTGRTVTWASSAPVVATVTGSGLVTAAAAGTSTVTAASEGQSATAAITVTAVPVASVTVTPSAVSQTVGVSQQLTATLKDASGNVLNGRSVTWTSNTPAVATVTASGLEKGVAAGTATITAMSEGKTGTAAITVAATVTKPGKVTDLAVGAPTSSSVTLSFTEVNDGTGRPASYDVRWAASPLSWGSAASVAQGTCKAPLAGTTIGAKRSCTVLGLAAATGYQFQLVAYRGTLNVSAVFGALSNVAGGTTAAGAAGPVASVTVSPTTVSQLASTTQQFAVVLKDASGSILSGRTVSWSSSNTAVATVSGTGLETSKTLGTATITATSEGRSGTAAITVTTVPPPPSGTWPNEPTGVTVLTDYGFTDPIPMVTDGTVGHGWNILNPDNGQPAVPGHAVSAVDATAPLGSAVADFIYPVGMGGGWAPATMYYIHAARQEVYAGFWWKASSPWQNHPSGVNKLAFWFMGNSNISMQMYGPAPYQIHVVSELPAEVVRYAPNVTTTAVTLGVWHRIEWHMKTTGLLEFWLDGVLQARYTSVQYPSTGFDTFEFSPTWGGIGSTKGESDHYWYNAVHLSGR